MTVDDVADNSQVAYSREMFDALCLRYEEPMANNRWDSPLFTVIPDGAIDLDAIHAVLFEKKPPPPNLSTQNVSSAPGRESLRPLEIRVKHVLSSLLHLLYFLVYSLVFSSYTFVSY